MTGYVLAKTQFRANSAAIRRLFRSRGYFVTYVSPTTCGLFGTVGKVICKTQFQPHSGTVLPANFGATAANEPMPIRSRPEALRDVQEAVSAVVSVEEV